MMISNPSRFVKCKGIAAKSPNFLASCFGSDGVQLEFVMLVMLVIIFLYINIPYIWQKGGTQAETEVLKSIKRML